MIRNGNYTEPIELGDAEYYFSYATFSVVQVISINAPFDSDEIQHPKVGDVYKGLGIEVKVEKVSSDYISDYVLIKVRPTVVNYMFSTYRYTKVDIPLGDIRAVDIDSGLINKTNRYSFKYSFAPSAGTGATMVVEDASQSKRYAAYVGFIVAEAKTDFDIEIRLFKADSTHMTIYVKPLY